MATMNTIEVAAELETTPRTLRKFLRSAQGFDAKVGKGSRWSIEKKDLRSLRSRFAKWTAAVEAEKAAREAAKNEANDTPEVSTED